jgi:signal transduction histidine kinase
VKISPAVRVAAAATVIIAVAYLACAIVLNLVVSAHLTEQDNDGLAGRLAMARSDPAVVRQRATTGGGDDDADDVDEPVFLWQTNAGYVVTAHSPDAPALPSSLLADRAPADGLTVTARLGKAGSFRLKLARDGDGWLVAGQSLVGDAHTKRLLLYGELIAGPFVLLAMFLGSLIVGLRALAPVEQSRRRQLEFTADASHELRTPLSVIRAEADVALSSPRQPAEYREALTRIQGESQRLRRLVEDMLWLARFDSSPPPPRDEPVDLATLAQACADRFRAVGPAITVAAPAEPALISAPPDWIDRLAGVLMDNACRYAGAHGLVRIQVGVQGSRVSLTVEDSGPGIPEADRPRLFDRFHRATEHGSGAGLGLAIGDSIVRTTAGRWQVGTSPLGGALMAVSWRHAQPHRPPAATARDRPAEVPGFAPPGSPAEVPRFAPPGSPAEVPESTRPARGSPAEVPESTRPARGSPAEVPESTRLARGSPAEVPQPPARPLR